jgi:hypothetical protein
VRVTATSWTGAPLTLQPMVSRFDNRSWSVFTSFNPAHTFNRFNAAHTSTICSLASLAPNRIADSPSLHKHASSPHMHLALSLLSLSISPASSLISLPPPCRVPPLH